MRKDVAQPQNKNTFIKSGDTNDIVNAVLSVIENADKRDMEGWVKSRFRPNYKGLSNLWHWVKYNVQYVEDPYGEQLIKTAPRVYAERHLGTDCKSFTVFITACLEALNIPHSVRFVSFTKSKIPTHVYCVAHLQGRDVLMDAVYDTFDKEPKHKHKIDYKMTNIHVLSGIDDDYDDNVAAIGNFKAWFNNKTVNKVFIMALHAFVPYEVKPGSVTARKVMKAKKVLKWFLKISPFSEKKTIDIVKRHIKEKIKMMPEDFFLEAANQKDKVGAVVATLTAITGLISGLAGLLKIVVKNQSGADQSKDDLTPNVEQLKADAITNDKGEPKADYVPEKTPLEKTTPEKGESDGGSSDSDMGKYLMPVLLIGLGFIVLKK